MARSPGRAADGGPVAGGRGVRRPAPRGARRLLRDHSHRPRDCRREGEVRPGKRGGHRAGRPPLLGCPHLPRRGSGRLGRHLLARGRGNTLDLTRFHDLVCATAERLRQEGDEDTLEIRKAKAIGIITDLATGTSPGSSRAQTRLFLHIKASDLANPSRSTIGHVERLGPATLERIRDWLASSQATILPVLDLSRTDAVDRHDPPAWLRELVIQRDQRCTFPWCGVDARRCDLDHIEPYVPPDRGGPPGQTRPDNLSPLCRRHHRLKTFGGWRYQRNPDGSYTWRSPLGRTYLVTGSGTLTR